MDSHAMEHDPRFKRLLQEFFAEFLMLFFPRQAARLDFRHIEWLDKESFANVAEGAVHVGRTSTAAGCWWSVWRPT